MDKISKKIDLWKKWLKQDWQFVKQILRHAFAKKRIIFMDTADHDNLGDHAIAKGQKMFVRNYLPDYVTIEIPGGNILRHTGLYKFLLRKSDIITIAGGGFLGDLWPFEEQIIKTIMEVFSDNRIVVFPQTFYLVNDVNFKKNHPEIMMGNRFTFCLRDIASKDRIDRIFPELKGHTYYFPDMVCGLNYSDNNLERRTVAICFRKDKESVLSEKEKATLESYLISRGWKLSEITTINDSNVEPSQREKALLAKFNEFSTKKLVITDRLHAMLFSAITGTPCIALDNISGKVSGVYKWISFLEYIWFVKDVDNIIPLLKSINIDRSYTYNNLCFSAHWEKLASIIREGNLDEQSD